MSESTSLEILRKSFQTSTSNCDADVRAEVTDLITYINLILSQLIVILL